MAIYDYLTPFEDDQQKFIVQPTRKQQPKQKKYPGKSDISPESDSINTSSAWYNDPGPFTFQTVLPMTPHSVLLRHNEKGQKMTPHPVLLQHEVPGLSHRSSSESAVSQDIENLPRCHCCGLLRAQSGSMPEAHCGHMCVDIESERECPDTHSTTLADVVEARSHEANSPTRRHRRHSLFYEPPSHDAGEEMKASGFHSVHLQQKPLPLEERSNPIVEECKPLEFESISLEEESAPLKQESTPFEHSHDYEDPYFPEAEERLSRLQ